MNMDAAGGEQTPAFTDSAQCRDWLTQVPLTNAVQAQAMLLRQINLLNLASLPGGERLSILEILRAPIHEVQEGSSRRFAGKPLPLAAGEQAVFDACRNLWRALVAGYMRCVEAGLSGDATAQTGTALCLQRGLAALTCEQLETHRAGRLPSAEHWKLLHQLFATAEQMELQAQEVADPVRLGKLPGSVGAAYAEALLLNAANMHELTLRQIGWVARWARQWAGKIRLLAAPPTLSTRAIPLCVDTAAAKPAGYMPLTGPGARWLETTELRLSLKKRLQLLDQGEPPAKLQLGSDCVQPACGQLLANVYQRWCRGGSARRYERRPAQGSCRFVAGIEAIHYYVSERKPFKPPGSADADILRREREELAMFGRVSARHDEHHSEQQGFMVEEWQLTEDWSIVDESAMGLGLARNARQAGARVGTGLLVAVQRQDGGPYLLGCVRWALANDTDALQAGVLAYPGKPIPLAVRPADPGAAREKFRQALMLPSTPALQEVASLILPPGTFKLDRRLDLHSDATRQVRLTRLLDRGADFERAAFEFV